MESLDRRERSTGPTRGHTRLVWDILFRAVRWTAAHAKNARATFGLLILGGMIVAIVLTFGFAQLAAKVAEGKTLGFDDTAMIYFGKHQIGWVTAAMVEITSLGTGIVVAMIVAVSGLFLWLYNYKQSAMLLLVATIGGIILNSVLKLGFNRPRPAFFDWGTHAASSSFPSGHAMSASIVYPTVAYLASRIQKTNRGRFFTMLAAGVLVVLISFSRMYLGVHYPSDVLAGVIVGLAWSAFCMATLEVGQLYAKRNAPAMVEPAPKAPHPDADSAAAAIVRGAEAGERRKKA